MRALITAAVALLLLNVSAAAQDCRDQVEALAGKLGLSTDLPQGGGQPDATPQQPQPDDLAK